MSEEPEKPEGLDREASVGLKSEEMIYTTVEKQAGVISALT